jgi:hypothetical protein
MKLSNLFLSLAAAALGTITLTQNASAVQEVGAGKTHATIQAAITASSGAGDDVVVYSGTYTDGPLTWNKNCNIVEAPGQTAILAPTSSANYAILPTVSAPCTWDGIDVQYTANFPGVVINNSQPLTFKNMLVTDAGGPVYAGAGLGFVTNTTMTLENVTIDLKDKSYDPGVLHRQGGNPGQGYVIKNCNIRARGMLMAITDINGSFHVMNSIIGHPDGIAGGNEQYIMNSPGATVNPKAFWFEDSTFIATNKSHGWGIDNQQVYAERCVFDARGGLNLNSPRYANWNHVYINCAFKMVPTVSFPAVVTIPGDGTGPGTLKFIHSSVSLTTGTKSTASVCQTNGKDVSIEIRNSIINLKGTTKGLSIGPVVAVTAGTNLRLVALSPSSDTLTGTIINGNPLFLADFVHVDPYSPAHGAGVVIPGIINDIDKQLRPNPVGSNPDLGGLPGSRHGQRIRRRINARFPRRRRGNKH